MCHNILWGAFHITDTSNSESRKIHKDIVQNFSYISIILENYKLKAEAALNVGCFWISFFFFFKEKDYVRILHIKNKRVFNSFYQRHDTFQIKILQNKNGMFPYFQHTDINASIRNLTNRYCREHVLSSLNPTKITEMGKRQSKKIPETKVNRLNLQYSKVHHWHNKK